jgi:hypothetical protein
MEKQHSIIFLIKNKTIALIVLFLMKITRTLRVRALAWYAGGRLTINTLKHY